MGFFIIAENSSLSFFHHSFGVISLSKCSREDPAIFNCCLYHSCSDYDVYPISEVPVVVMFLYAIYCFAAFQIDYYLAQNYIITAEILNILVDPPRGVCSLDERPVVYEAVFSIVCTLRSVY